VRKLLIKLVAIETAFVGWLSYWLFLVYANNPAIADQLVASLQKFPQLSFSTIDIAVLVIIAALAVTLAFKFQRGLRPGIRLERALQMLENLMKRNLILESQVAELRIEKTHPGTIPAPPLPNPAPAPTVTSDEPRTGSWEKAFRTPLEAGPPITQKASASSGEVAPFSHQTGIPPIRIEPQTQTPLSTAQKPTIVLTEKGSGRNPPPPTIIQGPPEKPAYVGPSVSSRWEDSPRFIGESKGILTPSSAPRRAPVVSDSGGLKQPYIPAPAPKPPSTSVVVGPLTNPVTPMPASTIIQPRILSKNAGRSVASPKTPAPTGNPQAIVEPLKTEPLLDLPRILPVSSTSTLPTNDISQNAQPAESKRLEGTLGSDEKTRVKDSQPTKKKTTVDEKR
jgi:hypothetical protein